jgi:multiple sugar transport system substrate-binding protein
MKNVKYAILTALGFIAIVIFTQCHLAEKETNPTNESSELLASNRNDLDNSPVVNEESTARIRFACDSWQAPGYEKLAEVFHQANPDIEVEIYTFEDDLSEFFSSNLDHTSITHRIVSSVDTAVWSVTPAIVQHGMVQDLTPFLEVTSGFERQDFHPGMLELFEWNSGVWALPAEPSLLWLVVYNKDAFDKSGLDYPEPGWGYEEFQNAVKTLTIRDGDSVAQYGFVDLAMVAPYPLITGQLSTPILDESSLTPISLVDEEVIAALRWYIDLIHDYDILSYNGRTNEDLRDKQKEMRDLVKSGQVAMWTQLVNEVIGKEEEANIGLAPFPSSAGQGVNPLFANGYIISPGTAYPMESWRWISFLTHHNVGNLTKSPSVGVPARRSVATDIEYWARWNEGSTIVLQYALEHTFSFPSHLEMREALQTVVRDVLDGGQVEEVLIGANAKLVEAAINRERATPAPPIPPIAQTDQQPEIVNSVIVLAPRGFSGVPYGSLAQQFQERHNTVVRIAPSNTEIPPDCYVEVVSTNRDIERMESLNLQPFIDTDPDFSTHDFHPSLLDTFRVQGDLWGIPTQSKMWAILYNKEIFDKAGLPYPKAGWTLEDFVSYAIGLTQKQQDERQYGYVHLSGDYIDLQVFAVLLGARLWDEKGQPRFTSPDVVSAIEWYMDLEQKYEVTPSFMESYPVSDRQIQETRRALLENGQVAMWTDFVGVEDNDVTHGLQANTGIAPMPLGKAGGATLFLDEGFFIDPYAKDPQQCWEWLKFANSQGAFSTGLPAHQSILTSASFMSRVDKDILDSYAAMLNYARVVTPPASAEDDLILLFQALNEIREGKSLHEALRQAQAQAANK